MFDQKFIALYLMFFCLSSLHQFLQNFSSVLYKYLYYSLDQITVLSLNLSDDASRAISKLGSYF